MVLRVPRSRLPLLGGVSSRYIRKVLRTEPDYLLCYWPFGEKSGAVADNAEGDAAFDAAYTGVTLGQEGIGDGGTAPFFDAANDSVNVYSAALAAGFDGTEGTLMWWFRARAASVWSDSTLRCQVWLSCGPDANDDWIFIQKNTLAGELLHYYAPGNGFELVTASGMSGAEWICGHMVWSDSGDYYKVFHDGSQVGSTLTTINTWTQTLPSDRCKVGAISGPDRVWDGWLAHVALWTKPLSIAQIEDLAAV